MKHYSLFIFLGLLLLGSALASSLRASDLSLLENLRKSEFGRTLLKSIQLHLKAQGKSRSSNALSSILDLVNKIREEIEAEQTAKQESYETEKAECSTYVSSLETEISTDQQSIDDNSRTIIDLQGQLDGYTSDLAAAEELQQSKEDQIDSIDTIREEEQSNYNEAIAELNTLIQTLRDGRTILQKLLAASSETTSFLERNNILAKPSKTELFSVISLIETHASGYLKLGNILLNMVASQDGDVDQTLLNKVLDLIDQLIATLTENRQVKITVEEERETAYESERSSLEAALVVVGSSIDSLKQTIKDINDQLLDLNQENIDLESKIETDESDKADKEQACSDYYHAYITESQNRSNELEIIDKIINIFETRFDLVDEYIRDLTF